MIPDLPRRLMIERDPDRARLAANEVDVIATGCELPSGEIVVEWNRDAFEPDDRAEEPVRSRYQNREDAEQASAGTLVFVDEAP